MRFVALLLTIASCSSAHADDAKKTKARTISCEQVASAYYSDAEWAATPTPRLTKAQRTRAIAESRKQILERCAKWTPTARACVMDASSQEARWDCLREHDYPRALVFSMPVGSQSLPTGIAACDEWTRLAENSYCSRAHNFYGYANKRSIVWGLERGAKDEATMASWCADILHEIATEEPLCYPRTITPR